MLYAVVLSSWVYTVFRPYKWTITTGTPINLNSIYIPVSSDSLTAKQMRHDHRWLNDIGNDSQRWSQVKPKHVTSGTTLFSLDIHNIIQVIGEAPFSIRWSDHGPEMSEFRVSFGVEGTGKKDVEGEIEFIRGRSNNMQNLKRAKFLTVKIPFFFQCLPWSCWWFPN